MHGGRTLGTSLTRNRDDLVSGLWAEPRYRFAPIAFTGRVDTAASALDARDRLAAFSFESKGGALRRQRDDGSHAKAAASVGTARRLGPGLRGRTNPAKWDPRPQRRLLELVFDRTAVAQATWLTEAPSSGRKPGGIPATRSRRAARITTRDVREALARVGAPL